MKRTFLLLAIAALAFPAAAAAKGPSGASISGPGTGGGIDISGSLENGSKLMTFSEGSGFFPAVFRQTPDPMRDSRPKGDLGPKYTVTYTVPGPNNETWKIQQDLYPYAEGGPVTYMKPGQKIFEAPDGTRGGWYLAHSSLKDRLVEAGLPATPPSGSTADDSAAVSTGTLLAIVAAMALLLLTSTILLRRRTRPAAA
jgi:hypothetical protein